MATLVLFGMSCRDQVGFQVEQEESRSEDVFEQLGDHTAELSAARNKLSKKTNKTKKETTDLADLEQRIMALETKLREKRHANTLGRRNTEILAEAMEGHTKIYPFNGKYRVLVIPVQFSDAKFDRPDFFTAGKNGSSKAQSYLFGDSANTMKTYYKHASLGKLEVDGVVSDIVTVDKPLVDYGEAVAGRRNDKNARRLVVDSLVKLRETKTDDDWWESFDNWDLSDYDSDKNYNEADGFIDAVILVYAGKSQSSCQRAFDPDGLRPASADVPAGPRQAATVECFNRIWPHRWSISISKDDDLFSPKGPLVEGVQRPSMNGLKITENLFAVDYNMQSEYSDRSTFMHEFGHSLSLPDVYAYSGDNNTGSWELMSQNASLQAQELSTFSKLSLGWVSPKIVEQGKNTSAYLGASNFVAHKRRKDNLSFNGPRVMEERVDEQTHVYDVVSNVPSNNEPVYRSVVVKTNPTDELIRIVDFPDFVEKQAAYTGRYDGQSKSVTVTVDVPEEGDATLSFDTIYHIETETNFSSNDEIIKVVTDYDLGSVVVNDEVKEDLRLVSGDNDFDSLNESNEACDSARVLELRALKIADTLSEDQKKEFGEKTAICQAPIWVKKSYDLSNLRGQSATIEIKLVTDAGYTEFGIVLDNIKLGETLIKDFEGNSASESGQWKLLANEGQDVLKHNQFYLMEYRSPNEVYRARGKKASLNMDRHLSVMGNQSMFLDDEEKTPLENFRMVEMKWQPRVLVWYYNSKFSRRDNGASVQGGKGYLLVVNSKVKEVPLPGVFAKAELKDDEGNYNPEEGILKDLIDQQHKDFTCFAYVDYATYQSGAKPECEDEAFMDAMQELTRNGKPLRFRREWFNNVIPFERYGFTQVGKPFRNISGLRTMFSTFRPADAGDFKGLRVLKVKGGKMIVDRKMTSQAATFPPVDQFRDAENELSSLKRFHGDNVVVEKKGFGFKVVSPSSRVVSQYSDRSSAVLNNALVRRPRVKVYFNWE